ncbi:MAG: helix-turn-helix domain-containing protein [Synergistes sp.]|nr:helix-turn-helix domain-containing protein [Synergistes sp.]
MEEKRKKKSQAEEQAEKETAIISLGKMLAELRESQRLSLDDAQNVTKIPKRHLKSIEEGRLNDIPKGPFCRSFLKQYCTFLSADDIWVRYDRLTKTENPALKDFKPDKSSAKYTHEPKVFRHRSRIWVYVLIIISLAAAAWVTWQYRGEIKTDATTPIDGGTAPIVEEKKAKTASADSAQEAAPKAVSVDLGWMDGKPTENKAPESSSAVIGAASADTNTTSEPAQEKLLRVTANGVIWVKFSLGGKVLFEGILKNGESREFAPTADEPLRIRYGNPAKSLLYWNGKEEPVGNGAKPITRFYWYDGSVTESK